MHKPLILCLVLLLTLACNLPLQAEQGITGVNPTDQIATDVAQTLTAFAEQLPPAENPPDNSSQTLTPEATLLTPEGENVTPSHQPSEIIPSLTPTPTPSSTNGPRASLGEPDWKVSFTNGKDGFYDDDDDQCIITPQNGKLILTSTMKTTGWHSWSMHYHKIKNFYLEANLNTQICSSTDEYGLIFRAPDYNSGYFLGLTCDGKYNLRTLSDDYHTLSDWTATDNIKSGSNQSNLIGVKAEGNHFSIYINNHLVKEIDDTHFPDEGMFGVFIAAYNTPGFTIELDDIAYWNLE